MVSMRICGILPAMLFLMLTSSAVAAAQDAPAAAPDVFAALSKGNEAELRSALKAGASVNQKNGQGETPMTWVAASGTAEQAKLLIERGADVLARNQDEYQPFDLAVERYNLEVALILLDHWVAIAATPAEHDGAALVLAAAKGEAPTLNALLDSGAVVDVMVPSGYTALAVAARWGRKNVLAALLARGAAPDLSTRSRYNSTPLMEASRDGRVEVATLLIGAGAKVDTGDRYGDHSLNWAAYFGHAPFVEELLKHRPDLQRVGQTDDWPLEIAIRQGHVETIALLRQAGAEARPGKDVPPTPAKD